jgi:predicted regulator of Ras-like GTPase activity (Roadblock/LC7/MglB family)
MRAARPLEIECPMADAASTQEQELDAILDVLTRARGVLGALVATEDGLPLAVRLQSGHDAEALAGAAGQLRKLAKEALQALAGGELELGVIDTSRYRLIVRGLANAVLLVVAEPEANLGVISRRMSHAAEKVTEAVSSLIEV